jgi:hypothetical protein
METATQPILGQITAADIAAIKKAQIAILFHFPKDDREEQGQIYLTGQHPIPCKSKVSNYSGNNVSNFRARYSETQVDIFSALGSALRQIRKGDVVELWWMHSNNNEHLTAAGLNMDQCHIVINRKGKPRARILVGVSVTPPDSTAKMISPA